MECLTPLVDEVSRDVVLGGSEGWLGELFLLHFLLKINYNSREYPEINTISSYLKIVGK